MPDFVPLPGSERAVLPKALPVASIDPSERIEVTIITRRRAQLPAELVSGTSMITRDELSDRYGSNPADVALIREVLARYGLDIVHADIGGRRVTVAGTVAALQDAFGASLQSVATSHSTSHSTAGAGFVSHRYREGPLHLPAELSGIILAVLGLDTRPQARPHTRRPHDRARMAYTPPQVADIYQFPPGTDGTGQTLAFIELGGGYSETDLDTYFAGLGLVPPSVTAIGVDGASNAPGQDPLDAEVVPNIEIAGAVAPGAEQFVYFAPNTDRGFVNAVTTAVHATPTPTAVGISWGHPEDSWTPQARNALHEALADAAALGVTVCVATGNNGSGDGDGDGLHVDFPASSPHALACGGTSLHADPATGAIRAETVWNDGVGATGGGVSDVFPLPSWQAAAGVPAAAGTGAPGRGVPDVAGNADPATGYQVLVNGQSEVTGGTSAATALWTGLMCRMAQASGFRPGAVQPLLYAGAIAGAGVPGFRSITAGNNGAYSAGPGWDACTGLGTPDGISLLIRLAEQQGGLELSGNLPGILDTGPEWDVPTGLGSPGGKSVDQVLEERDGVLAQPSPPPPPPPPQPVSYDDLVRKAIAELVQPGQLLFNPPDRMELREIKEVEVRLTRTLKLDAELRQHLGGTGIPQVEEIDTAPLMAVTLRGDGFRITANSEEEQSVTPDRITIWQFDIQALKRGQQRLVMSVSLRIPVPGQPVQRMSIPVREATIDVHVGTPALVGHFVADNWQWFIGTAVAIAGVVAGVLVAVLH
jgi:kumamolisin